MYFKTETLKIFSIIFELVLCDGGMKRLVMQILLVKQEKIRNEYEKIWPLDFSFSSDFEDNYF